MSKRTPGPWRKTETEKGRPKVVDRYGFTVCTAGAQPYNHADFDLLAAAPDLLEALEDALGELETMSYARYAALENKCRAAIAKAKGEQL